MCLWEMFQCTAKPPSPCNSPLMGAWPRAPARQSLRCAAPRGTWLSPAAQSSVRTQLYLGRYRGFGFFLRHRPSDNELWVLTPWLYPPRLLLQGCLVVDHLCHLLQTLIHLPLLLPNHTILPGSKILVRRLYLLSRDEDFSQFHPSIGFGVDSVAP